MKSISKFKRRIYHWCLILVVALGFMTFITAIDAGEPKVKKEKQTLQSQKKSPIKVLWVKEYEPEGIQGLEKKYGGVGITHFVLKVKDGILVSFFLSTEGMHHNSFLIKLNLNGEVQWQRNFGKIGAISEPIETINGYIILGESSLILTNKMGKLITKYNYNKRYFEYPDVHAEVSGNLVTLLNKPTAAHCSQEFCYAMKQKLLIDEQIRSVGPAIKFLSIPLPRNMLHFKENEKYPSLLFTKLLHTRNSWSAILTLLTKEGWITSISQFDESGKLRCVQHFPKLEYPLYSYSNVLTDNNNQIEIIHKSTTPVLLKVDESNCNISEHVFQDEYEMLAYPSIPSDKRIFSWYRIKVKENYLVSGYDLNPNNNSGDYYLMMLDKKGSSLWKQVLPEYKDDILLVKMDDGIIMIGMGSMNNIRITKIAISNKFE